LPLVAANERHLARSDHAASFRRPVYKFGAKCLQASQTEVTGTNKVSGCYVPAFFTGETVLRWPIALMDKPAFRAPWLV
jgi:hypothetical protein